MPWENDTEDFYKDNETDPYNESYPSATTTTTTTSTSAPSTANTFFGTIGNYFGSKGFITNILDTGVNIGLGALKNSQTQAVAQAEFERKKQLLQMELDAKKLDSNQYQQQMAALLAQLQSNQNKPASSSNLPLIIGASVGGLVLVTLIIVVATRKS